MSTPLRFQPKPYIVPVCQEPLTTLYADDDVVVVHKPAGLLSVPGRDPLNHDSVLSRLQADYVQPIIVHRLDMSTSGVMVIALHKAAAGALGKQFEARTVGKRYVAVVDGLVESNGGELDWPLVCDWPNRPLQMVCYTHGKPALTVYTVLQRDVDQQRTRVSLVPHTGRSHQLRVHMRELGHAILGCELYAPDAACYAAERLLLHAEHLAFVHPVTAEPLSFECPADF